MKTSQQRVSVQLNILIPGLFEGLANWPDNCSEDKQKTVLGWLLSRGDFGRQNITGLEASLWHCFDSGLKQNDELPVAALRTNKADLFSLCADPVHLQIGVTDVEVYSGSDLMLSQMESEEMATLLNDFLKQDGYRFELDEAGWGVFFLNKKANIKTTALSSVSGQLLTEKLPSGPDQSRWLKLSNEIQMLFHEAAFNQQREAVGKLPINALWLWGGGQLLRPLKSDYKLIASDVGLAKLFAKRTKTKIISVPESFDQLLEIMPDGKVLLVLDKLLAYSQKNDYLGWTRQLEEYEQRWFKSLKENVRTKAVNTVGIMTSTGERFDYFSHHRWRFWRKKRDLQDWINR